MRDARFKMGIGFLVSQAMIMAKAFSCQLAFGLRLALSSLRWRDSLRFRLFRLSLFRGDLGVYLRQKLFAEIGNDSRIAVIVILSDAIGARLGCARGDLCGLLKASL